MGHSNVRPPYIDMKLKCSIKILFCVLVKMLLVIDQCENSSGLRVLYLETNRYVNYDCCNNAEGIIRLLDCNYTLIKLAGSYKIGHMMWSIMDLHIIPNSQPYNQ